MDSIKRIYQLNDETDFVDSYLMSDKFGYSEAKKIKSNLLAFITDLNISEITDVNFFDFNYSGYASIYGIYTFEALGSQLSNLPFVPVAGNLYKIVIKVKNLDAKIHFCEYHIQSSGSDFNGKNKYYTRLGSSFAAAIAAGFSEYTLSPFNYVEGIQQIQGISQIDVVNNTGEYIDTTLSATVNPQDPNSIIRLDFSFLMEGANTGSTAQFRLIENEAVYSETTEFFVGNKTLSNSATLLINPHLDASPLNYHLEFKNINGTVSILGSQKFSSMVLTEVFSTQR